MPSVDSTAALIRNIIFIIKECLACLKCLTDRIEMLEKTVIVLEPKLMELRSIYKHEHQALLTLDSGMCNYCILKPIHYTE